MNMIEFGLEDVPFLLYVSIREYLEYDIGYLFLAAALIISVLVTVISPKISTKTPIQRPRFTYLTVSFVPIIFGFITGIYFGMLALSFVLFFWTVSFLSFIIFQTIPKQNLQAFFPAAITSLFISFTISVLSFFKIFFTPSIFPGAITLIISTFTITTYFVFIYKKPKARAPSSSQ